MAENSLIRYQKTLYEAHFEKLGHNFAAGWILSTKLAITQSKEMQPTQYTPRKCQIKVFFN